MEQICPMLDKILQCLIGSFQVEKEVLKLASITIRIPDEEKERLEQLARKDDVTVSGIVRRAIRDFLAKQSK